jgi:hypothetical protein
MPPVSKKEYFEIIDRLLKIEDDVLNFGYIESNMKVLKYVIKLVRFEYYINDVQGRIIPLPDFFNSNYQRERDNILNGMTITAVKLDNRFRKFNNNYIYKYSIKTLENQPSQTYNIVISVFLNVHLYNYDKYVFDYNLEHPEQYQISHLQIKKKYWQELNKELIENRFNPINIEKFESWGFDLDN